jgi:hypothetical protein
MEDSQRLRGDVMERIEPTAYDTCDSDIVLFMRIWRTIALERLERRRAKRKRRAAWKPRILSCGSCLTEESDERRDYFPQARNGFHALVAASLAQVADDSML